MINQNFLFGVLFIIGGHDLRRAGHVPPIVAAAMHTLGSLIVVFNSARLVRKGEELEHVSSAAAPEPPARGNAAGRWSTRRSELDTKLSLGSVKPTLMQPEPDHIGQPSPKLAQNLTSPMPTAHPQPAPIATARSSSPCAG